MWVCGCEWMDGSFQHSHSVCACVRVCFDMIFWAFCHAMQFTLHTHTLSLSHFVALSFIFLTQILCHRIAVHYVHRAVLQCAYQR